jgi:hypothetical protein
MLEKFCQMLERFQKFLRIVLTKIAEEGAIFRAMLGNAAAKVPLLGIVKLELRL